MKNGFVIGLHVPQGMRIDLARLPVIIETQHVTAADGAYNFLSPPDGAFADETCPERGLSWEVIVEMCLIDKVRHFGPFVTFQMRLNVSQLVTDE